MKYTLIFLLATGLTGCATEMFRPSTDLFAPRADLPVGPQPKAVAIADIDGDGRNDIIVVRSTPNGAVTLLLGRSDGNFGRLEATSRAGDTPFSMAVADLDKDGALDVAVGNFFGAEVAALYGKDLQTTRVALPADGSHPFAVNAADLDGNGSPDLIAGVQVGDALNVFMNQGGRNFAAAVRINLDATPGGIAAGDFDGDGAARLDVAVALPESSVVRVLHGQGGGMLATAGATELTAGMNPIAVVAAQLDADGALDLAAANAGDGTVSVLLRSGNGFAQATSFPVGQQPSALAVGDLDGDGFLDIVTSNRGSETITVLRGLSSGRFSPAGDLAVGKQPEGIAVGDVNGDGLADIAVANLNSDNVSLFLSRRQSGS